jgi:PAS domain S-box-containing protein
METARNRLSWSMANPGSPLQTAILVCLVVVLGYLAAALGGVLMLRPQMVWPLWPGNAILSSLLLLVPRRRWPLLLSAGLVGFVLYDLQVGVTIRSAALLILANTIEILTATVGVRYAFGGVPRLNSVKALAKYSVFAVILAPLSVTFVGAMALRPNYWTGWRISFFSEALAFLTVTPAILGLVRPGRPSLRASRKYYLEAAALIATLISLSYFMFTAPGRSVPQALPYSLVPLLLWSALRFGATGVSTSMIAIAFLSIWGAARGRGPFLELEPLNSVLSLQLFLVFTSAPFMVLAALVEERKQVEQALRESEERLRLAAQAGRMYAFEWDAATDKIVRSGECLAIFNWMDDPTRDTGRQFAARVHPGDHEGYAATEIGHTAENPAYQISFRMLRPDGSVIWLEESGHAFFDDQGRLQHIIGMVADVTARKQAEGALRESDERFRLVANHAPVLIWMSGTDKLCTFFNKGWLDFTGRSMEQELGEGWASGVHPDDLQRCLRTYSTAFDARVDFELEYRLRRFDGEYRWIVDYGVPRFESDGAFCGYIGSCVDITDRKLSEASLQELSGRLIHAQEEERTRIARELHDDLSQRMALLQIGLEQLAQEKGGLSSQNRQQLRNITKVSAEVSSSIHDLSHQLHPYKLDTLGLAASLGGFSSQFSREHNLQIQFVHHDIPRQIPKDVTLCLFRIAQEALRNVMKHSGASKARVELSGHDHEIDLCISDSGVGFDPEAVKGGGLGLISMRERLRVVRGHLVVESEPSRGTRIRVRVPLPTNGVTGNEKAHKAGA